MHHTRRRLNGIVAKEVTVDSVVDKWEAGQNQSSTNRRGLMHGLSQPIEQEISFEELVEGRCAQIMHIGPYATEPETIDRLMTFTSDSGLYVDGLHHEIYLSDPRRVEPSIM